MPKQLSDNWMNFNDGVALAVTNLRQLNEGLSSERGGSDHYDMKAAVTLLRELAESKDREIVIRGDGRAFLESMGFAVARHLGSDRDLLAQFYDR